MRAFFNRAYRRVINNVPDANTYRRVRVALRRLLPARRVVSELYAARFGRAPNLTDPQTFNEKLAWRKLYQHDERFPIFADKIAVKREIVRLIDAQQVLPTLWSGADPAAIPFERLIPPYVIKVNHGTGGVQFVRETLKETGSIIGALREQLRFSHARITHEWAYTKITPQVLIEPLIEMPSGEVPDDYKFFVYHGQVHFVQVDKSRFVRHARNLYTREGVRLEGGTNGYPPLPDPVVLPARWDELVRIAERIGAQFDFVRIDLYDTPRGVIFGEVTFYPGAGLERFSPQALDLQFGRPWILPVKRS
jgi:TupA-like ATPgrasp